MKKILIFALMCVFAGAASAQTQMVRLTRFEGLNMSGLSVSRGIKVEVYQSDKTYATIEMPAEYENNLIFEIDGAGIVKIGLDDNIGKGIKGFTNYRNFRTELIKAKVYMKSISHIRASSSSDIVCFGMFYSDKADIDLSSSGRVSDLNITVKNGVDLECSSSAKFTGNITTDALTGRMSSSGRADIKVQAKSVDVRVSSSGSMEIAGFSESLKVNASSGASFMGSGINSTRADLNASSGARINAGETNELLARASSGGSIRYKGLPKHIDVNTSSGGSIHQAN